MAQAVNRVMSADASLASVGAIGGTRSIEPA
jgi:hypothetical protein